MRVASMIAVTLLLSAVVPMHAGAVVPTAEVNDLLWCVDQSSQTLRGIVHQFAGAIAQTWDENYRSLKCKLHQRPGISITSDPTTTDPALLSAWYGIVRGTGTPSDPYVIENWEIAGSDTFQLYAAGSQQSTPSTPEQRLLYGSGIHFGNVQKYYLVNKVYVHGFNCALYEQTAGTLYGSCGSNPQNSAAGITITPDAGGSNIRIENSLIIDNTNGIKIRNWGGPADFAGNIRIVNNDIHAEWIGVFADMCTWCTEQRVDVIGNRIYGPQGPNTFGGGSPSTTHGIFFTGHVVVEEITGNRIMGQTVGAAFFGTRPYGHSNVVCAHGQSWYQTHAQGVGWWWDCTSP